MAKLVYQYYNGRRYLTEPEYYPLPADLIEMHRQTLKTLALLEVHGAPYCNPYISLDRPPKKVLDLCCGTGIWSLKCHEYFSQAGHTNIEFVGLDIAPLAADLTQHGVNWKFVQWDIRNRPIPLPAEDFDFIFMKDTTMTMPFQYDDAPLSDVARMLKKGGIMEFWESDMAIRTLVANPTPPTSAPRGELNIAERSATYLLSTGAAFAPSQHKWLERYNSWLESAFAKLKLTPSPCQMTMWVFQADPDNFTDIGSRRVAIPLCETRWEKESSSTRRKGKKASIAPAASSLSTDQAALRRTMLEVALDMITALEPTLRPESDMGHAEWEKWISGLTTDLLKENGAENGECLETGVWWARRPSRAHGPAG